MAKVKVEEEGSKRRDNGELIIIISRKEIQPNVYCMIVFVK